MRTPIILASSSPRRRELLADLGIPFAVVPSDVDETPRPGELPVDLVRRLARMKATKAARFQRAAVVLAADTIVVVDGDILNKPVDRADARAMLERLAGREHVVLTGFCVIAPGGELAEDVVATRVRFRPLGSEEIERYLETDEAYDKAGGYAIQGGAGDFIEAIEGSYSNVVGLPQEEVAAALGRFIQLPLPQEHGSA